MHYTCMRRGLIINKANSVSVREFVVEASVMWMRCKARTDLVSGEDAERRHDLLGRVGGVGRLASHEVEERLERHVAETVGVDRGHDALEVGLALRTTINHHDRSSATLLPSVPSTHHLPTLSFQV